MSSLLTRLRNAIMTIVASFGRGRRNGTGGGGAPVVTTVVVTPSSFTNVAGTTRQLAAQSYDQYGSAIADTFTWGSNASGVATVNSAGLVTAVAAGSVTITATSATNNAKSGPSGGTVTAARVVTTVVVSPSSFTVATTGTQQLTAQSFDQFGAPITDTFTWMSSASGQATVNSSGLVTGVASGSPTITATSVTNNTKSGTSAATVSGTAFNPSTGAFIGGSNGAVPINFDAAPKYASDNGTLPKWRDVFANKDTSPGNYPEWIYADQTKNGTIPYPWTGAKYTFDTYCDLAVWQNSVLSFNGDPMFKLTIIGDNQAHSAPVPDLRGPIASPCRSLWLWTRKKMPNFTAVGDATAPAAVTFNASQAKAYKMGPSAAFSTSEGRGGLEMSSGSGHNGQYESNFEPIYGGSTQGVTTTNGSIAPIWDVGAPEYDHLVYLHGYDSSGTKVSIRVWRKLSTDPISAFAELGTEAIGTVSGSFAVPLFGTITGLTGLNMNCSFSTNQSYYVWGWAAWNPLQDASSADPFGVL